MVVVAIAIVAFLILGQAVSNLVAGSMGQTPTDRAWNYVVALVITLGVVGGLAGVRSYLKPSFARIADILMGALSGAIVGFYYAGIATGKDPRWAISGAVLGGVVLGVASWRWRSPIRMLILNLAGALGAYGFAFLIGMTAFACLNVGYALPGALLGMLTLLYLWFTWKMLRETLQTLCLATTARLR